MGFRRIALLLTLALPTVLSGCFGGDRPTRSQQDSEPTGQWHAGYLRDNTYADGRIFDLAYPGEIGPYDSVRAFYLFQSETDPRNPWAQEFYLDCGPLDPTDTYDRTPVLMKQVAMDRYELAFGLNASRCPVVLVFPTEDQYGEYAVFVEIARHDAEGTLLEIDTIGHHGPGLDTLRIIRPADFELSPDHPAWQLMWRNCYPILRNISYDDIEVNVFRGLPGMEGDTSSLDYQVVNGVPGDPYIEILGLDQWDNAQPGIKLPDGVMDYRAEIFRPDWGLLILPEREPFNSNRRFQDMSGNYSDLLVNKVPNLYYYYSAAERAGTSEYFFQIRYWVPDTAWYR
jgi:hypothetical protein